MGGHRMSETVRARMAALRAAELEPLYSAALPADAPGAWIRRAIERPTMSETGGVEARARQLLIGVHEGELTVLDDGPRLIVDGDDGPLRGNDAELILEARDTITDLLALLDAERERVEVQHQEIHDTYSVLMDQDADEIVRLRALVDKLCAVPDEVLNSLLDLLDPVPAGGYGDGATYATSLILARMAALRERTHE
jgi:hypothetical protein